MSKKIKKAVISWTGGKDCALAFYETKLMGIEIVGLVTFVPTKAKFLAHPLELMKLQAESIDIPHYFFEIKEPFKDSYRKAIKLLRKKYKVDAIVTGDIAEIGSCTNWMQECAEFTGVSILKPLWYRDRNEIAKKLIDHKFEVIFTGVKKPWFSKSWIGRKLDKDNLDKLQMLNAKKDVDICGENGEYHTQVLNAPFFKKRIKIEKYSTEKRDDLLYINTQKMSV